VVDTLVTLSVGTSSTIGDQTTLDIVRIDEPPRRRGPRIRRHRSSAVDVVSPSASTRTGTPMNV
jgi:hypothetical protein